MLIVSINVEKTIGKSADVIEILHTREFSSLVLILMNRTIAKDIARVSISINGANEMSLCDIRLEKNVIMAMEM